MGRWRPPAPQSSPYITPAGFATLQQELKDIWTRRRDVVKALAAAAAEGDRSENAEYIYRKKELAGLDRRIRYLQKRLPALTVVERQANTGAVYFGAVVTLTDASGVSRAHRLVGPDETDAKSGAISIDSPLAKAILGKTVGDEVAIRIEDVESVLQIVSIDYDTPE